MQILLVGDDQSNVTFRKLLSRSPGVTAVHCWPGPHDDASSESPWSQDISAAELGRLAHASQVDLVVLTSESAIDSGIANVLEVYRIPCAGPTRVAAHFASEPEFFFNFARRHRIPVTARSVHDTPIEALRKATTELASNERIVIVVKNAQGTNHRYVCSTRDDLKAALYSPLHREGSVQYTIERHFPDSSHTFHFLAAKNRLVAIDAQDDELGTRIASELVHPFLHGLTEECTPYTGWLAVDVVVSPQGPLVREIRTLPTLKFVEDLAMHDRRDWLDILQMLLRDLVKPIAVT